MDIASAVETALVAVAGGGLAFIAVLPTRLGDLLLGDIVSRRLERFRAEQNSKIEALKATLAHVGDRGSRANEQEFRALTKIWTKFVEAHDATQRCVIRYTSHPDLDQRTREDLEAFLSSTELSEAQRRQVLAASEKNNMYAKIVRFRLIGAAGAAIFDAREATRAEGIFIPAEVETSFEAAFSMLSAAQVHEQMSFEYGAQVASADMLPIEKLFKEGPVIALNLKNQVRARFKSFDIVAPPQGS